MAIREFKDRLALARKEANFATPTDAARAHAWTVSTYLGYENGNRKPSREMASRIAQAYRVSLDWLVDGRELPRKGRGEQKSVSVMGHIGAGAIIEPEHEQIPPEGLYEVDLPFSIPDGIVGFEVRGDSMLPRYDDGDVILVWNEPRRAIDTFYGEEAAVRTTAGRRYLKTIMRGRSKSTVVLNSFNAKPIENVSLDWIGEIYVTVRAGQIRRLNAKERASATKRAQARERETGGMQELPGPVGRSQAS